jgi:hypothetical protein
MRIQPICKKVYASHAEAKKVGNPGQSLLRIIPDAGHMDVKPCAGANYIVVTQVNSSTQNRGTIRTSKKLKNRAFNLQRMPG